MEAIKFNPAEWVYERSSGYDGKKNTITGEWIYDVEYQEMKSRMIEETVWENTVFRIIKLHTRSNALTEKIVDELKKEIKIYKQ